MNPLEFWAQIYVCGALGFGTLLLAVAVLSPTVEMAVRDIRERTGLSRGAVLAVFLASYTVLWPLLVVAVLVMAGRGRRCPTPRP